MSKPKIYISHNYGGNDTELVENILELFKTKYENVLPITPFNNNGILYGINTYINNVNMCFKLFIFLNTNCCYQFIFFLRSYRLQSDHHLHRSYRHRNGRHR